MSLYRHLLEEASRLPEDPEREERRRRTAVYMDTLRKPISEEGYVTAEEIGK
jgi:hypothetical protein